MSARVGGDIGGTFPDIVLRLPDGSDRRPFVIVHMITGAWGGRPDKDGMKGVTKDAVATRALRERRA
jgi:N-methylhydantoinase B/oxoprolinase/acetone carboxylase alpha subunit